MDNREELNGVSGEFWNDLEAHDVFKLCWPDMANIAMINGDADEVAPVVDARRFAKQFGAKLTKVKGADHRIMIPGGMEQVIDAAVQFFSTRGISVIDYYL